MVALDVFNQKAFSTLSLTTAINKAPFAPKRLGSMGLFTERGIMTTTALIEERHGKLHLLSTAARGTQPTVFSGPIRHARSFVVPHIPLNAAVFADDVQNIRAFGSETELETVSQHVNDKLAAMRQSFEATWEWHRIGAVKGVVLDGDASTTLFNWFTEFGITQTTKVFYLDVASFSVKAKAMDIIRDMEDALGMDTYQRIHCLCGNTFFDQLISNAEVKEAYDRFQDSAFFRATQRGPNGVGGGFMFADIMWENYRGGVGGTKFIADDEAYFFPVGVPDLFQVIYAPGDFMETVNTTGRPIYVKQERMRFDKGVELHAQSNPLHICTRPSTLIKGTYQAGSASGS
jgi:hypothetical protein